MLLAAPCLLAACVCTNLIADSGRGWLNLLLLLFIWNAQVPRDGAGYPRPPARTRVQEGAERRRVRRQSDAMKSARYQPIGA